MKGTAGIGAVAAGSAIAAALTSDAAVAPESSRENQSGESRPRRPARLAAIDIGYAWLRDDVNVEARIAWVESRLGECLAEEPDIVCLPETFAGSWVKEPAKPQAIDGPIVQRFAAIAKAHRSYLIIPLMIAGVNGSVHNGAVLVDRSGDIVGVSYKTHLTVGELRIGIRPGPIEPPVLQTDFGSIGIQICYDANHMQTWAGLVRRGAEVVFFPSEFHGGRILNSLAWMNQCWVVSATGMNARIIDPGGDDLIASGNFRGFVCDTINLDACLVHIWPHVRKLPAIRQKYGQTVRAKLWQDENYFLLESLNPEVSIHEILAEFSIPTYREQIEGV